MRRAHSAHESHTQNFHNRGGTDSILESENDRLTEELKGKISAIKSYTIEIGSELRSQNKFLSDMDNDMDGAGGFLDKAVNRVKRLGRGSQNYITLYLILFSLFIFLILWLIIKF